MKKLILIYSLLLISFISFSQEISVTTSGVGYGTNFNTLVSTSTSSILPNGWYFTESGTNANTTYSAGNGSSNAGDTYSFGLSGNSDRALGGLRSGSLNPTWGCKITNNTGGIIESIMISYTGEVWRIGSTLRKDRIDFSYSTNATSITTGTWVDVNQLDYSSIESTTAPLSGSLLQSQSINYTISGLMIQNNTSIWFRFTDVDATGSDDGLAIDDFTLTPVVATPLPIELLDFYSENNLNSNIIYWTTASENNSDYFILERSDNGYDWSEISRISASGNSNNLIQYMYVDDSFEGNWNYYRLKQYDLDGIWEMFGPIVQYSLSKNLEIIKIYNLLGKEVDENYKGFVIVEYENGKLTKKLL